ncbi:MAG: hypothetical protein K1X35_10675 [Caulobacteraceae bacterium]|nr:hypothetical protein [Caulobacteraceae bacterium]
MGEGWKRAAILAGILALLGLYTLWRGVPERAGVDHLEVQLALYPVAGAPGGAIRLDRYVRYYADARPRRWSDLHLQSPPPAATPAPDGRTLIIGRLVDPILRGGLEPGVRRVRLMQLPVVEGPGCLVVNVIYDPARDEILAGWCNAERASPRL